jgi:MGT family glycosyltransferase
MSSRRGWVNHQATAPVERNTNVVDSNGFPRSRNSSLMPLRFLLTSWGNPGNLNPLLTAARRLRQKGHHVRILGEVAQREETAKAGFEALSWRRPAPPTLPSNVGDDPTWTEFRVLVTQIMFGSAIDYAADTIDALRSEAADAILTNDFLVGPVIAAEAMGLPCALLSPHISVRPLEGVPIGTSGLIPADTAEYKVAELAARRRFIDLMESQLPALNRARAAYGLVPLSHIFDHYDRADRVLIGLSAAFDFPATRLPANLRYVGPLLDQPSWAQPWTAPWSGRPERPRVLVSLSTSFQNQLSTLKRITAALGRMELDAVVTIGPAMAQETIEAPANVTVLHSAPHDAVMREVSLVITHGGHGTVTRSLTHGVPLLVLPMGRDQADNAARVVARGAGLAIADTATEAEIGQAVARLLTEPQFQAAASRLGQTMAPELGSMAVVAEMEAIAARSLRRSA